MDGASNRRIVRSTIARLDGVRQQAAVEPDEVLVVLAWTQTARHEYYSRREHPEEQSGPLDHAVDRGWQRIGPWRAEASHRPSVAFYEYLWSEDGQMTNLFVDWVLLDRYLRYEGYQARYAFAFPLASPLREPALQYASQLDGDTVWGGLPPALGKSFLEMPATMARGPGGHPLTEGHGWFAASLAEWLSP